MNRFLIGVHILEDDVHRVRGAVDDICAGAGLTSLDNHPLATDVVDSDLLPDGDDWYGIAMSGRGGQGWVSVYVRDWPDSGALAQGISGRLHGPALEIWATEDSHWGYTYYEDGQVRDRFADSPAALAETAEERTLFAGNPSLLQPVLAAPVADAEAMLVDARKHAGRFAGASIESLARLIALPYGQAIMSYDEFFDSDPEDYQDELDGWEEFRHLTFRLPEGRDGLTD